MKYVIDIDGTICEEVGKVIGRPPYKDRIEKINKLYDEGHTIVYWTARGCRSGIDHTELTKTQLLEWGAKYHRVEVGNKPHFDMYICDKSYNSESFFHSKERGLP